MKNRTGNAFQSSAYPLQVADQPKGFPLKVIKEQPIAKKQSVVVINTDDPANWDVDWFANYE